jgi:geranylgeranyl diphosphate synthase type II
MHSLPQLLDLIRRYSQENPFPAAPRELYEPCEYMLALGGKRLRPAMLLMGYELFRDEVQQALPAAWAVELFHNFTLMHDDMMDAAPLRRGQPTVHTKWNAATGILSGDVMLIHAYRHLLQFDPEMALPLIDMFSRMATGVCEGQQMDMNFESRSDVDVADYLRMIELKTAVLLGYALSAGATCAFAGSSTVALMEQLGRTTGIAFQIQDDLLDTYGDPAKFGKQVGGDILQNKKTLLVLKAMEVSSDADRRELTRWMHTGPEVPGDEKIAAVRALFDRNGVPQQIAAEKKRYQDAAFQYLDAIETPAARKSVLWKTLEEMLDREN